MGDSLIEELPKEILFKILTYVAAPPTTPDITWKKCFYVSKKFNKVLNEYLHYFPKRTLERVMIEQRKGEIHLNVLKWSGFFKPTWRTVLTTNFTPISSSTERVTGIYGQVPYMCKKKHQLVVGDLEEGLENYMFSFLRRADFYFMVLMNLPASIATVLKNVMKRCKSKAEIVMINTGRNLSEEHVSFIQQSGCRSLTIYRKDNADVNKLFKNLPYLTKMSSLTISPEDMYDYTKQDRYLRKRRLKDDHIELNDESLLASAIQDFSSGCRTSVTHTGILRLLQDFIDGRREIRSFTIKLSVPDVPTKKNIRMVPSVENLVKDFRNCPGVETTKNMFTWHVERIPDKLTIVFYPKTAVLEINNINDEDEDEDET